MKKFSTVAVTTIMIGLCVQFAPSRATAGLISLTQLDIGAETDIANGGSLITANSLGASPISGTVNAVTFGTSQSGLTNFTNGGGDFATQFTAGSGLDRILSNLVFSPNTNVSTLSLGGLTIGNSYRLQLLFSNPLNGTGHNMGVSLLGGTENIVGMGSRAVNVVAEFTADASSVVASFSNQGFRTVFNAYALHSTEAVQVSAPATPLLMLSGLIGLMALRRRMAP